MKFGLTTLLFTACASTGTTMDTREPASHANVQFDLSTTSQERAVFPALETPRLPSVDRISHQVRAQLGDEAIAAIDLCVAPDGRVTEVRLAQGSSFEPFDTALLHDARQWQFAAMPGQTAATRLQTCERATVKYLTPQ